MPFTNRESFPADQLTTTEVVWVQTSTSGIVLLQETTAPSPTTGYGKLYVKTTDKHIYYKDSLGNETDLLAGITGAVWGSITGSLINQTDLQLVLNAKQNTLSFGNLTELTSSILTIGGGTGAVIGTGVTLTITKADASHDGYLAQGDFSTFAGKQNSLGLTDPGANALAGWDDTDNAWTWFTLGVGLAYNHAFHSLSVTGLPSPSALTKTDDTNVTLTLGGTPATSLLQAVSLTLGWAGTLAIARGGTGAGTKATAFDALSPMSVAGDLIYGGASGTGTRLPIGGVNTVLHGGVSVPAWSAVVEADISLSAITTNNVSTVKHGFCPTLSNITTQFFRGDGAWAAPGGTTVPNAYLLVTHTWAADDSYDIVHNFGTYPLVQAYDSNGYMIVPYIISQKDVNTTTVQFEVAGTFTILLTVGSPELSNYVTSAISYNMLAGDYIIEITGAATIVTLLTPVGRSGKRVIVKNYSGGVIDVQTAAGTIDGIADVTLADKDALEVFSNGTNWRVM